jgi:glycosidase
MKKGFFNLLLSVLMFGLSASACKKEDNPKPPVIKPEYEQYGTPFSEVPDPLDATIYQVNIRCFSSTGNFTGVIARLDSIKNLGINVIYLMPVYPVGKLKSVNSPYCVQDYKAVNPEFGTLTDLRKLIDGAHTRGMAVILDWVANHTAWDHVWMDNKSWYKQDTEGNIVSPNSMWKDVAQLDFQNHDMITAMIKAMKYWVYSANCDGFRCDYTDGPPFDFWQEAIDSLRNISTHKLLLLAEGTRFDQYMAGFNFTFGFRFYGELKMVFSGNATTTLDNVIAREFNNVSDTNSVVRYITNHDVNSSDGTPLALYGGKTGSFTAFIITAYMKGIPMIYNGQEVAYPNQLTFPFTSSTIDWTINKDVFADYKKVIAFRNGSQAIKRGALKTFSSKDVCAFTKTFENETVLVIANVRNSNISYTLPATLSNTTWQDAFSGTNKNLGELLTLEPYSWLILKK